MSKPVKQSSTEERGLVISYFGSSVAVEVEDGQVFQCHLRRNQALPVVGDWVSFKPEANQTGTVISIEPRRSLLSRGEHHGKSKAIAANIDTILIVMSPPPIFSEYLIDRYLIAAELLKIEPVLVINKADLLQDNTRLELEARCKAYQAIPYPVVLSSAYTHDGLSELANHIKDKSAVLVGPSGVGKSSIISALGNHAAIPIGEVSPKGAGKHTTTATRLYHLPEGGQLIDSPGVREFNLWQVTENEVLRGFKEFQPYINQCKFRDCSHLVEPGCGVQEALASGKISPDRFESYQKLTKEAVSHKKY
jgi:ribosome biogenesis GTPase